MEKDLISIIIPVYNVEKYIEQCVNSIINQTYRNLEIILIDDGSTDNSGNICENLKTKDSRIKVIHKENGGQASARNVGILSAKGKYIGFVDSDDYIKEDMYELLYNNLIKENEDLSISGVYRDTNGKIVNEKKENVYLVMNTAETYSYLFAPGYFKFGVWEKLYKADKIKNITFPEGRINGEDLEFTYKVIDKCKVIVYDSTPEYYYRYRINSTSNKKKIGFGLVESAHNMIDFFKNKYPELYNKSVNSYVLALLQYYNNCLQLNIKDEKFKFVKKELFKYKNDIDKSVLNKNKLFQLYLFYHFNILYNIIVPILKRIKCLKLIKKNKKGEN